MIIENIKSKLVYAKIFIQRSMTYVSIINSFFILFIFLSGLEKYGIDINLKFWYPIIIVITPIILILFGFLEDKFGIYKLEVTSSSKRNLYFDEIVK